MMPFARAGSVVVLALTAGLAPAADQKDIDAAVQKGTEYLKGRFKDGRQAVNAIAGHGIGPTALAGLALLEAKTPANDPTVQAIAATVRDAAYRETQTYQISLCLFFLDRLEDRADVPLIQLLAVRLLAGQSTQGGWGYQCILPVPPNDEQLLRSGLKTQQLVSGTSPQSGAGNSTSPPKKDHPPAKTGPGGKLHPYVEKYAASLWATRTPNAFDDNSNTQFGLLAVWVARKHGVPVDFALEMVEKRFLASQDPQTGGWSYITGGMGILMGGPSPSMSCAGLLGLSTAAARRQERRFKVEPPPRAPEPGTKDKANDPFYNPPPRAEKPVEKKPDVRRQADGLDAAVQRGMAYLTGVLTAGIQSGGLLANGPRQGDRDLYFLWSLERVAVIYGVEKFGDVDWYAHGSAALLRAQGPDGAWVNGSYGPEVGTAFAILFLTRANIARDLSLKVQKDPANIELRGGTGPAIGATGPAIGATALDTKSPAEAAPGGNPKPPAEVAPAGGNPKPLPAASAEDGAAKLAAGLVKVPAAGWTTALEQMRDAKGTDHTRGLVLAIHQLAGDRQKQAREALAERLTRMTAESLRGMTTAADPELRRGAVLACAMKDDKTHVPDLIARLTDDEEIVVRAARAGLKSLTGKDLGPAPGATKDDRKAAAAAWQTWWAKQK